MNFNKSISIWTLNLLFFILISFNASAQNSENNIADSLNIIPVQLSDISMRSAETLVNTKNILENLISDEEILRLKLLNDSILNKVLAENEEFFNNNIESKSIRYLESCILQIKKQKTIVENEKTQLSEILNDLAQSIKFLNDEQKIWAKTRIGLSESGFPETMIKRLDLINYNLDSAFTIVSLQAEDVLTSLDRSSEVSIKMDVIMENLGKSIRDLEEQRLQNDYPDVFNLDYSAENLRFTKVYQLYLDTEWAELKLYLPARIYESVFTLILFILLLLIFYRNQNLFIAYQKNTESYYKRKLGFILSKPITTALLISLFSTIFIFPDRPPAFRDLVFFLFVIPIIILVRKLLDKQLLIFVYGFSVLFLLIMFILMLPPENVIFRYNLLLVAFLEICLIWLFLFRTLKILTSPEQVITLARYIGYMFFIMAIISFLSAVSGNVVLSKSFLFAINFTIMAYGFLYTIVLILKGLLITLLESNFTQNINFIKNHGSFIRVRILYIINVTTTLYIIYHLLIRLSLWKPLKDRVFDFLSKEMLVGEISFSIGAILLFFVVIYFSILLGRVIQIILEGDILDRMSLKKGIPHTISMMVRYTLVTFGVFLGISATGIQLSSMTVIIGAFSVGIGFGLQNIFFNVVSGFILLFDRPIKIGDTLEVGNLIGTVSHIGIRTSNVKTFDGAEVIVPNGKLISNEVINWTLSDQQRRIEVLIGVSYKSDPQKVHEVLLEVLNQHKDVLLYPQPHVLFKEMGESSLDFRLLFWTESVGEWLRIQSEVTFKAFEKLKENNIEIPFPQRDLHLKSINEELNINPISDNKK